ncbi:MAG: CBS domain-containing protein [Chloroflexota bacterium]|nr:MAG: CBS domain-containing protein [Chloroflexota bacterium]
MKTAEIMTKEVITIRPSTPVSEIARLMGQHHLTGIPVTDDLGRLRGMVTDRDLVVRHARVHFPTYIPLLESLVYLGNTRHFEVELRKTLASTAGELMSTEVPTVGPETDILDVAALMFDKDANPIPVVDHGQLVGIISRADLVKLLVREEEPTEQQSEG